MSRNKKNWDQLVDPRGQYVPVGGGQKGEPGAPGPKGSPGGQKGEPGTPGTNGTNGDKGAPGTNGTNGTNGSNGEDGEKGEPGVQGQKGELGLQGQKGEDGAQGQKGEPGSGGGGTIVEPTNDSLLYGRSVNGANVGSWRRSVEFSGDVMDGDLTSPTLTTGPDASSLAILKMDTGTSPYLGGPHQLEARDPDEVYFDNEKLAKSIDLDPLIEKIEEIEESLDIESVDGSYTYTSSAIPGAGEYTTQANGPIGFNPLLFSDVTTLLINQVDGGGTSRDISAVKKGMKVTLVQPDGYGLTAIVAVTSIDTGVLTLDIDIATSTDDPGGGDSVSGSAEISIQDQFATVEYVEDRIDEISQNVNNSLNAAADLRGVIWVWETTNLPDVLANLEPIPQGKLLFSTVTLQLYIRISDAWLGLL